MPALLHDSSWKEGLKTCASATPCIAVYARNAYADDAHGRYPARSLAFCLQVGGYWIPKGTHVQYNIWGIQRDAKHWPDPCAFRPERFLQGMDTRRLNAFVAFGLGVFR